MAAAMSDYLEDKLMSAIFNAAAFPTISGRFLGLFTAQPGDTGTGAAPSDGTEVSTTSTGYARVNLTGSWTKAASGTTTQETYGSTVTFPAATASWGTVTGWGIWDAASGGNLLWYGAISPTQAISTGQTPSFSANSLIASLD